LIMSEDPNQEIKLEEKLTDLKNRIKADINTRLTELNSLQTDILKLYSEKQIDEEGRQLLIQLSKEISELAERLLNL
jgi:hypothetical protein